MFWLKNWVLSSVGGWPSTRFPGKIGVNFGLRGVSMVLLGVQCTRQRMARQHAVVPCGLPCGKEQAFRVVHGNPVCQRCIRGTERTTKWGARHALFKVSTRQGLPRPSVRVLALTAIPCAPAHVNGSFWAFLIFGKFVFIFFMIKEN